ncbi:CUB and sushi domain-containing protein 1-like [Mercenaria mercenaria]|uniref:CUB and sushi domain-containing protein 1-like n=1 Tax=Mercenaria mercenaria TaxID=6596 RepID=UPI00234E6AF1|nr:CUB and sushi domain-containing protein 1-like [Mercenaria mercenaria]
MERVKFQKYAALVMLILTDIRILRTAEGTLGREFYIGVLKPYDINSIHNVTLLITSANNSGNIHIQVPHLQINTTSRFNGNFEFNLPKSIIQSTNNTVEHRGIRVKTDVDISLLVSTSGSSDVYETFLALPTTILSSSYIISSYTTTTYYKSFNSNFLIVATEPNTTVSLTSTHLGQFSQSVSMNQYDTCLYGSVQDVSGITIRSNKAIAVFSGHEATGVPYNCAYGRYLVEQLLPIKMFGHEFIVPPVAPKSGFVVRIYSAEQNTTLHYINSTSYGREVLREPDRFYELLCANEPIKIQSDKPVQVVLYSTCYSYNSTSKLGDSFMTIIPAIQQYKNTYHFTMPSLFGGYGYLAITANTSHMTTGLRLDGQLIHDQIYRYDASPLRGNYSVRIYNVTAGVHTLENVNGTLFGAWQYGFAMGSDGAYGTIVGMDAIPINADCGKPPPPKKGNVATPNGTKYLSQAVYNCNYGYVLQGESKRVCNNSMDWSGTTPTCLAKDCGKLSAPSNGNVMTPNGTKYLSQAEYKCIFGYVLRGEIRRICNASGNWSGTSPTCEAKECGKLLAPSNGNVMTPNGTKYLSQAEYKCNYGYVFRGEVRRICNASGNWSGTTPTCEAKDCGKLSAPSNGNVMNPNGTKYLSQAEYKCEYGYVLQGEIMRICNASGNWSGTTPTCEAKDCGQLSAPINGYVMTRNGTKYLSQAEYSCNYGYILRGEIRRICSASGNWSGTTPTCGAKECGQLSAPINGNVMTPNGTKYLSQAEYSCNYGYVLLGEVRNICNASGNWNGTTPTCGAKDCGKLSAPSNGNVMTPNGTKYLSQAEYKCNYGYVLRGEVRRICNASGNWSGTTPTCEAKDCGKLSAPSNGNVMNPNGTKYLSQAEYKCEYGYVLHGEIRRICNASGNWNGTTPTCEAKECGQLSAPINGNVMTPNGTKYLSQAEYKCNYGYVLLGEVRNICNASGNWNGTTPTCGAKDCGQLSAPSNGNVMTPNGTKYLSQAEYKCNYGYVLRGEVRRICNASGNWSGTTPTCEAKDCGKLSAPSNGNVMNPNDTKYLSQAEYKCEYGYVLHGEIRRICNASGYWSGTTPTCEAKADRMTCLQCRDVYHTNLCNTVTKCALGQVCYVEKFTTHNGQVRYNTGCADLKQCSIHQRRQKRSANCLECCTSDLCNFAGCGSQGLPDRNERGPLCYDCAFTYNMDECKTISLCNRYESCSIEKYDWGGLYDQFISECKNNQCLSLKRSDRTGKNSRMMSRSTPICQRCCENDLCNFYCNVTAQTDTGVALIG